MVQDSPVGIVADGIQALDAPPHLPLVVVHHDNEQCISIHILVVIVSHDLHHPFSYVRHI
jgi:hypothetical protein